MSRISDTVCGLLLLEGSAELGKLDQKWRWLPRSIVNGAGGDVAERLKILLQVKKEAPSLRPSLQTNAATQ